MNAPGRRRGTMAPLARFPRDERGMVLPLSLFVLAILASLTMALLAVGSSDVQIAHNHLRGVQAQYIAEAGLEDALNTFRADPSLMVSAPGSATNTPGLAGPGKSLTGSGSYIVQYQSAGTNTIRVVSTGTSAVGSAERVLRAVFSTAFSSTDAVRTRLDLTISGNPTVAGACGSVHTNEDLSISGNPSTSGNATATGAYSASGNPSVGAGSGGGKPVKPIPAINPPDFLVAATKMLPATEIYQMKADGKVLDGNGTVLAMLTSGKEYRGWKYKASPTSWDLSGNKGYDGTYYLEGNVKISGNPGSKSTLWRTSIIATGDIEVSGNPEISVHLADTLFVAGLDIKLSGNPTQGFHGLIAAHEQITISGNPSINGYIIAEDATATSDTSKNNSISGNPTITYDCGLNPPLLGPIQILAWGS